jgi:hypothetical protein
MSQQQSFINNTNPVVPNIEFIQGNSGSAIGPNPTTHIFNLIGVGGVTVSPAVAPYTQQISVAFTQRPWTDQAASFNALAGNGYFVTATATATLPASPNQGDSIDFIVDSVSGILTIQANTGQIIVIGTSESAPSGIAVSHDDGDSIQLVYRAADTAWTTLGSPQGTFTVT